MAHYYIATAYQSNLINFSVVGHFTSHEKSELLSARTNFLELSEIAGEELCASKQVPFPFPVAGLWSFLPDTRSRHYLIILTRKYEILMVQFDASPKGIKMVAKAVGKFLTNADLILLDTGPTAAFRPFAPGIICFALYKQRFEIVKFHGDNKPLEVFPIRVENHDIGGIVGLDFQHPNRSLLAMVMLQQTNKGPLLTFFNLNLKSKEKEKPEVSFSKLDLEADLMIPVPLPSDLPGVLVVGNGSVQYYNKEREYAATASVFLAKCGVVSWCILHEDAETRCITYMLGCNDGRLVLVVCRPSSIPLEERKKNNAAPCKISVELLGISSVAQTLSVLCAGLVFVGACAGPSSMIIRMRQVMNCTTRNYFDVVATFPAFGSILDLQIMKNVQKQGLDESFLLACSADTFGNSLTIVRGGIKLEDPVEIPLSGVMKVWALYFPLLSAETVYVMTTLSTTRCAVLQEGDLCEIDVAKTNGCFRTNVRTLFCGQHPSSPTLLVQVTTESVMIIDGGTNALVSQEKPPLNHSITGAHLCGASLFFSYGTCVQHLYLGNDKKRTVKKPVRVFDNEICGFGVFAALDGHGTIFCVVGEWKTLKVTLLKLPDWTIIQSDLVPPSGCLPQRFLYCDFGQASYLFCGLGDGNVHYFRFNEAITQMVDGKRTPLGTRPLNFVPFLAHGNRNVFVCSDRPCAISYRNGKLSFSDVNIPNVIDLCMLQATEDQGNPSERLIVVAETSIMIGQLEDIQNLHLIPISLGFQAYRFAYQADTHVFGVIGDRKDCRVNKFCNSKCVDQDEEERLLYILDKSSFESITIHRSTNPTEYFCCVTSWRPFPTDEATLSYFVLGTEKEGRGGSLIVLQLINQRLQVIHTYSLTEAVRNVAAYDRYVLATAESDLIIYEWLGHQLEIKAKFETGFSMIYHMDVQGDTILLTDLQNSVIVLQFDVEKSFQVIARDFSTYGLQTASLSNNHDVFGSDDCGNLVVLGLSGKKLVSASPEDENCQTMLQTAALSLGDPITSIRRGSMISGEIVGCSVKVLDSLVFGTCKGQLGVILQLDGETFSLLRHLEMKMASRKGMIGGLSVSDSLQFCTSLLESSHYGFVNGDMLETLLHLRKTEIEEMLKGFKWRIEDGIEVRYSAADIVKILDDLVRLH